ncbi:hypothetical protein FRB99_001512 [Tulasnella sp. 403]|nr:hypothetical protein FRB99_001512 [Tulasnella sp. 403]
MGASTNPGVAIYRVLLSMVHLGHAIVLILKCLVPRPIPKKLTAERRLSPKHVALLLHVEPNKAGSEKVASDLVECVRRAVEWCNEAGIETLSVYDERGLLKVHLDDVISVLPAGTQPALPVQTSSYSSVFPITPPPSDGEATSSSSSTTSVHSPLLSFRVPTVTNTFVTGSDRENANTVRQTRPSHSSSQASGHTGSELQLNVLCRDQSKPAIARAAQQLSYRHLSNKSAPVPQVDIDQLDQILEADFSSPDFLIIHPLLYPSSPRALIPKPFELYGFPPWQIRLSEMYYDPLPPERFFSVLLSRPAAAIITETDFRRALDSFAQADFKVGK